MRKVHNLILLPSLEAADKLSRRLEALGGNLHSDGRPIIGLSSRDLLEITLETAPDAVFIPAHLTPTSRCSARIPASTSARALAT